MLGMLGKSSCLRHGVRLRAWTKLFGCWLPGGRGHDAGVRGGG